MDNFRTPADLPFAFRGYPSVDVSETEKNVIVKAELPGMDPKDVDLSIEKGTLVIRGEKKQESEEKNENYHRVERSYGSFHRSIPLPCKCDADKVKAKYKNGVLTVTLPKDKDAQPRRVSIES
jgi:HSP20 family protein